jgi:hypothetical protein
MLGVKGIEKKPEEKANLGVLGFEKETDNKRGLPPLPPNNSLIDFDRQAEIEQYAEFEEELEPIHRLVTIREQKILDKASRERYVRPQILLKLAPETEKALKEANENILNPSRNTFRTALGDEDGSIKDYFESSRDYHLGGHQSHNKRCWSTSTST